MISRWCAGEPQEWTFYEAGSDDPGEKHMVDPHQMCLFHRNKGHDDPSHRDCCWGPAETESRDCTCPCHAGEEEKRLAAERQRDVDLIVFALTKVADKDTLLEALDQLSQKHPEVFLTLWGMVYGNRTRWTKKEK